MSKAWQHRLRFHRPRLVQWMLFPNIWWYITGQSEANMKPRCTFAEMGADCPVVIELQKPTKPNGSKDSEEG